MGSGKRGGWKWGWGLSEGEGGPKRKEADRKEKNEKATVLARAEATGIVFQLPLLASSFPLFSVRCLRAGSSSASICDCWLLPERDEERL